MNYSSPEWQQIAAWAQSQIDRQRERNDTVGLSDSETAVIRGEIRALKRLLDLPNEAARVVKPEPGEPA